MQRRADAQAVGNALYGLQSMSSEAREVRGLLDVLRDKVAGCREELGAGSGQRTVRSAEYEQRS